jgi:hypothetical protein
VAECLVAYVGMLAPVTSEAALVEAVGRWLVERGRLSSERLLSVMDARTSATLELGGSVTEHALALHLAAEEATVPVASVYRSLAQWRLGLADGAPHTELLVPVSAAADLARHLGDTGMLVRCLRGRLDHLLGAGRSADAARCLDELDQVSHDARHAQGRWWTHLMRAEAAIRAGGLAEGLARSHEAYTAFTLVPEEPRAEVLRMQTLMAAYQAGRLEEVAAGLTQGGPIAETSRLGSLQAAAGFAVSAQLGDGPARDELRFVVERVLERGEPGWLHASTLYFLGRAAVLLGFDHVGLRTALERYAGTWALMGTGAATAGPVDAIRAGLSRVAGDVEVSRRLCRRAEMLCDRMEAPFWRQDTAWIANAAS